MKFILIYLILIIIFYSKILNLKKKYHSPKIFENQCPTIFWKSMSHDFLKFIVQDYLEFNVPRFFATLAYLTA